MNVPKLRFKEFNDEYINLKYKDVLKIKSGRDQRQVECESGIYPILGTGGQIGKTNSFLYDKPSVLIGRKGTINKPQYMETPFWTVDTLFYSHIYEPNIPKYLFYSFQNVNWKKYDESTGVPSLSSSTIESVECNIPSKEEQLKVADFLSLLDKKIELQSKKIEDLKLFTKNTISNELNNLQNYNIFKFKDICNIQTGKSNTQDKCDDGIYPFYIRSENIERSNNYIFDCEAVLTIGDGNIGKVFFYENGKFDCHQRVYVLNNFKNVLGKYVYYYFSSFFYKRAMSMNAKNTVDSVRMEMISDMIIKVPQENEQIKMINLFSSLDKKLGLEQNKLDKIQELKKGLMQNMFI